MHGMHLCFLIFINTELFKILFLYFINYIIEFNYLINRGFLVPLDC